MIGKPIRYGAIFAALLTLVSFSSPIPAARASPLTIPNLQGACTSNRVTATLRGTNEGPPNASPATGTVTFDINPITGQITGSLLVSGLTADATAAHIHTGVAGINGPVLVPLTVPVATSFSQAQNTSTTPANASNILANPQGFYVNVHSAFFPGGEIRGQLSCVQAPATPATPKEVPEADTLLLLGGGIGGLATWLRYQWSKRRKK